MENQTTNICPYLGMKNDPTTHVGYPSTYNVCHHTKRQEIPNLNYQRLTCLKTSFVECPIYNSEIVQRMPRSIRYRSNKLFNFSKKFKIGLLIISMVIVIAGIFVLFQQFAPKLTQALLPSWQKTQDLRTDQRLPTIPVTQIPGGDETPSAAPEPTATATKQPSGTPTRRIISSILALDSPIGADVKFIIHRVGSGESLFQYAREYNTNVDAIRAVNYNLPSVLFVDWLVVIPVGIDDPTGLPSFEVFQVTMRGLTVETLAEELSVEPERLVKYNNLPMDYKFSPGEWILVPRE